MDDIHSRRVKRIYKCRSRKNQRFDSNLCLGSSWQSSADPEQYPGEQGQISMRRSNFWQTLETPSQSSVDLPSPISQCSAVCKVKGELRVCYWIAPFDMRLHIGSIKGYINKIMIASSDLQLGANTKVNLETVPTVPSDTTSGNKNMGVIILPPSGPPLPQSPLSLLYSPQLLMQLIQ